MFCHLNVQLEVVEVNLLTVIGLNSNIVGKHLRLDIVAEALHGFLYIFIRTQHHSDMVGNLQTTLLTDVLNAVDELTGHTFILQFIGEFHLKGYGQVAFVSYQPARNILADDIHIDSLDSQGLTLNLDADATLLLELGNLLL